MSADRVALVTGGGSGIGRAVCLALAADGRQVAVGDLNVEGAAETAQLVADAGGRSLAVSMDVTSTDSVHQARLRVVDEMGPIEVLVNCAGWDLLMPFLDTEEAFWDKVIDINFKGVLRTAHACLPSMVDGGWGRIINISSDAARVGSSLEAVYSGAKGGVICDPRELSQGELERITRRYTAGIMDILGPDRDVPAPDMNTNEQTMAWIMDTYSMHVRRTTTAVVTGKPISLGGSRGRREATGRGVMLCCREAMKKLGRRPENTRVIVQGSGNVGGIGALLLYREGYKVTSLSDMYGAIINENGLDIPQVLEHLRKHRTLEGYEEADRLANTEQIFQECDVLVPAATENQITSKNAHNIQAQLIVEGANGPTTAAAQEILDERGVVVVPDILANAGGVTVSYFEWVQDRMGYFWTEEVVNTRLEQAMVKAFNDVNDAAKKYDVSLRVAAYILAVERVAVVYRMRGIFA